ncbi:MAG: thioredoxin domain-containing protein [Leptolyngbyaceae bacterium]|nr:thioredoxin domain-containing protein [Leptolyngbyaceae bacterium]
MRKHSMLWLSLCLSSLVVTVSLVTTTSLGASAAPDQRIAQANPCASKNPCAAKRENVGGPLAKQLQGKPVVVDIYASWCPACKNIAPTLSQLKKEYAGKANFIVLDVTDKSKTSQSESRAKELGLGKFFAANKSQTGMVAIIDPATGNILTQHRNNTDKSAYTSVLNSALSRK